MLQIMADGYYQTGCNAYIIFKTALPEAFFRLSTGLAGEMLQKIDNYRATLAIVGTFDKYTSPSFKAFMWESNQGNTCFFVENIEQAWEKFEKSGKF